jgi:UDP-glucose 4-epimerase
MGYGGGINYCDSRKSDVRCHNASIKKMKSMVDFEPMSFNDGIKVTIDWYMELK